MYTVIYAVFTEWVLVFPIITGRDSDIDFCLMISNFFGVCLVLRCQKLVLIDFG